MVSWIAQFLDVKGEFLNCRFQNGEELYMGIPQGFEELYPPNVVLLLLRQVCGLKQAAVKFWRELQKALCYMSYSGNKADPCLAFQWIDGLLVIWIIWVDDCLAIGPPKLVT
eukprot:8262075-Ditylum_brightwellii.AAC.1